MDSFSKIGLTALIATGLLATHVKAVELDAVALAPTPAVQQMAQDDRAELQF